VFTSTQHRFTLALPFVYCKLVSVGQTDSSRTLYTHKRVHVVYTPESQKMRFL